MVVMRTDLVDPVEVGWRRWHRVLTTAQQRRRDARQVALVLVHLRQTLYPQGLGDP